MAAVMELRMACSCWVVDGVTEHDSSFSLTAIDDLTVLEPMSHLTTIIYYNPSFFIWFCSLLFLPQPILAKEPAQLGFYLIRRRISLIEQVQADI